VLFGGEGAGSVLTLALVVGQTGGQRCRAGFGEDASGGGGRWTTAAALGPTAAGLAKCPAGYCCQEQPGCSRAYTRERRRTHGLEAWHT
jgi:hypothetical protein